MADLAWEVRVYSTVNGEPMHYVEEGGGPPVLALHGAGVDHREIMAFLEPVFADRPGHRRIYPDLPGMGRTLVVHADRSALGRIFTRWRLSTPLEQGPAYPNPTLILAGRQDAAAGYAGPWRLLEHYPRATFAVLDRAGHALPHEQADLASALLAEWLDRVDEFTRAG